MAAWPPPGSWARGLSVSRWAPAGNAAQPPRWWSAQFEDWVEGRDGSLPLWGPEALPEAGEPGARILAPDGGPLPGRAAGDPARSPRAAAAEDRRRRHSRRASAAPF